MMDPKFRKVFLHSVILSIIIFACFSGVVWFLLLESSFFNFWLLEMTVDVLGAVSVMVVTWLLFPAVASFFVTLFLDDIVEAVESRYYPEDLPPSAVSFSRLSITTLRFTGITLVLNILAIPIYFFTIWFPLIAVVVYYCLNGYLLSREYYELVALRHLQSSDINKIRKANSRKLFLTGLGITFLFTIPIVNLLAPVIAVTVMTHIFKSFNAVEPV